jgi:hypothetical protein
VFTHECLAIRVAHKLKATDVIDVLSDLFILRSVRGHIRSDNGPDQDHGSWRQQAKRPTKIPIGPLKGLISESREFSSSSTILN